MRRVTGEFPHVPDADVARARLVPVPWLPLGVDGMTLGRFVLLRRQRFDDRGLLAHELVHVRQWREQRALPFLAAYLGAYLRGRVGGLGHAAAYRAIPAEVEARATSGWPSS